MTRTKRTQPWAVIFGLGALMLLAAWLRWRHLGLASLWCDEILDYNTARLDLISMLADVRIHRGGLPLHYFIQWVILRFGAGEVWFRLPAMLFGTLAVAAEYFLARRVFRTRPAVAWLAAMMGALSVFQIRYAQEARFYALFILLSTILWWAFFRARENQLRKDWMSYGLIALLAAYTHYYTFLILMVQGGMVFFPWLRKKLVRQDTRADNNAVVGVLLVSVSVFTAFIPALVFYTSHTGHYDLFHVSWRQAAAVAAAVMGGFPWWGIPLLAGLTWHAAPSERRDGFWLLAAGGFFGLAVLGLDKASGYFFHVRQMIFIQPLMLMLWAAAMLAIFERLAGWTTQGRGRSGRFMAAGLAAMVVLGIQIPQVRAYTRLPLSDSRFAFEMKKTEWREAAAFLRKNAEPTAAVVCLDSLVKKSLEYYFRLNHENGLPVVEVNYDMKKMAAILDQSGFRDMWLVDGGIFDGYLQRLSPEDRERLLARVEMVQSFFRVRLYRFRSRPALEVCRRIDIGDQAASVYLGEGWWEDDRTNPGVAALWSRAPSSTLIVPIRDDKPKAMQLTLRTNKPQPVRVSVQGKVVGTLAATTEWQTVSLAVSESLWTAGNNVIRFEYARSERFDKWRKRRAVEWDACTLIYE